MESPWSRQKVLWVSLAVRFILVGYSTIHDYLFRLSFTDIDYSVYHDGAMAVLAGGSPYDRATYRYSPVLAWILLPNAAFHSFGKLLFCSADIVVAVLCLSIMDYKRVKGDEAVVSLWLANPLICAVSARGNADSLVVACSLFVLFLLQRQRPFLAALVHGSLAIQLKMYPVVLLPAVYLSLADFPPNQSLLQYYREKGVWSSLKKVVFNAKGLIYVVICLSSFAATQFFFYFLYGQRFLDESLLHHLRRKDIRHNFSVYFFLLYLADSNEFLSSLISRLAFIPQITALVLFAVRYSNNLPLCSFLSIYSFVTFNKVCTSQYFLWYISFLPIIASSLKLSHSTWFRVVVLWFFGQALFLLPAYLFEFQSLPTLEFIWIGTLIFLVINVYIMCLFCRSYNEGIKAEEQRKKN